MHKRPSPLEPTALIFITTLLVYLLVWSGKHYSIDGIVMFEYAKTMLFQHSFFMDPPVYWAKQNIVVSIWSLGQTLVYTPILLALSALYPTNEIYRRIPYDPHNPYNPLLLENSPYRYASLVHPVVTALSAVLVYTLGRRLGFSKKAACVAALIFGLASPAAAYARYDFAQPLVSLFLLAGVVAFTYSHPYRPLAYFLTGLFTGLTILTRPEMAVIAGAPFCLAILWNGYRSGELGLNKKWNGLLPLTVFAAPLAAILLFLLYANQQRFGSPLRSGFTAVDFNFNPFQILIALVGSLVSPARGLLLFFPLCVLSPAGFAKIPSRIRNIKFLLAWLILVSILLYASWGYWSGGRSWGPRFLIPLLPYLALLSMYGYQALQARLGRKASWLFAALTILGWAATQQGLLLASMNDLVAAQTFDLSLGGSIFSGWARLASLPNYDIFWVQKLAAGNRQALLVPLILLPLLMVCLLLWRKRFQAE